MPFSPNNFRKVTWNPDSPSEFYIRWREVGSPTWVLYPTPLFAPEALFGVTIPGDPYPPGYTYIAILQPNKNYEVQIQHKCSATNSSSWSTATQFNTNLPCPEGGVGGFSFTVTADPANAPNGVLVNWQFDDGGDSLNPAVHLHYKHSSSASWTIVPYPRNNTPAAVTIASINGNWEFKIVITCQGSTYSSSTILYNYTLVYPSLSLLNTVIRPGIQGVRATITPPTPPPGLSIIGFWYKYYSIWYDNGVDPVIFWPKWPSGTAPSPNRTLDIKVKYSDNGESAVTNFDHVLISPSDWAAQSVGADTVGAHAIWQNKAPDFVNPPTANSTYASADMYLVGLPGSNPNKSFSTGLSIDFWAGPLTPGSTLYVNASIGNNIVGRITHPEGWQLPKNNEVKSINIPGMMGNASNPPMVGTITIDTAGIVTFDGYLGANTLGYCKLTVSGPHES